VAAICEGVRAHVSLSHDGGMATAVVVLERTA
jgi:phosphopantetheinyl transferase (holo-ACP synthase)